MSLFDIIRYPISDVYSKSIDEIPIDVLEIWILELWNTPSIREKFPQFNVKNVGSFSFTAGLLITLFSSEKESIEEIFLSRLKELLLERE